MALQSMQCPCPPAASKQDSNAEKSKARTEETQFYLPDIVLLG
jgi:hypothetical protein